MDKPLPELVALPTQWALFDQVSPGDWEARARRIHAAIEVLTTTRGIGVAQATKILHIKRPHLIPVLDSYVAHTLNVSPPSESASLEQGMVAVDLIREMGLSQPEALAGIAAHLASDPGVSVRPSYVRIVDALLWAWQEPRYQTLYDLICRWSA